VTKNEVIDEVARRANLGKKEAGAAVDALLSTIESSLKSGDDVAFTGFGKFSVSHRAARQGVHPRTGAPMSIEATRVPRFTAGTALKKAIKS
jgi:DNA-binding protein HU-beta